MLHHYSYEEDRWLWGLTATLLQAVAGWLRTVSKAQKFHIKLK